MRDIKFRGKRKDNGEWVYGYFWRMNDEMTGNKPCITVSNVGADNFFNHEVILETVGQFTELKEIYEGDIVNDRIETCVVEWNSREAKFNLAIINDEEAVGIRQTHKPMPLDAMFLTVIGNIHDKKS